MYRYNRRLFLLIATLALIFLAGLVVARLRRGSDFYRYVRIETSMKEYEVTRLLESEPSLVVRIGSCRCLYFQGRNYFADTIDQRLPLKTVRCCSELPSFYGAIEVLTDERSCVIAYTWAGETSKIRSISGDINGDRLAMLPAEFSEQHCASCNDGS